MPLFLRKVIDSDTLLGIWKITESSEDLIKKLQLKPKEIALFNSFKNEARKRNWLGSRVLVRELMGTDAYIDLQADEYNRPIIVNFPHQLSISHSYDFAAVLLSKNKRIGVDIEIVKEKIERIKHKFLSDEELGFIKVDDRIKQLYVCWCAKESLYKLYGEKALSFKENMYIHPFEYQPSGIIQAEIRNGKTPQHFSLAYCELENYMLAWVVGD